MEIVGNVWSVHTDTCNLWYAIMFMFFVDSTSNDTIFISDSSNAGSHHSLCHFNVCNVFHFMFCNVIAWGITHLVVTVII